MITIPNMIKNNPMHSVTFDTKASSPAYQFQSKLLDDVVSVRQISGNGHYLLYIGIIILFVETTYYITWCSVMYKT